MAKRVKTRYLEMNVDSRGFVGKLIGTKHDYDFSDIALLRNLLTNQKAKILYTLKNENINSIYELSKFLKRDLKSLREDIKILERFGFIELKEHKKNNRKLIKPTLSADRIELIIDV